MVNVWGTMDKRQSQKLTIRTTLCSGDLKASLKDLIYTYIDWHHIAHHEHFVLRWTKKKFCSITWVWMAILHISFVCRFIAYIQRPSIGIHSGTRRFKVKVIVSKTRKLWFMHYKLNMHNQSFNFKQIYKQSQILSTD